MNRGQTGLRRAHGASQRENWSWYYNLWVSEHNRQPLAKIDTIFVNNTEYNFQDGYTVANTSGSFRHDIINNYFITGPTDPSGANAFFQMNANQSIYSTGNLLDNNNDGSLNGSSIDPGGGGTVLSLRRGQAYRPMRRCIRQRARIDYDVSLAGALPHDQLDSLIISQIKTLGNGTAAPARERLVRAAAFTTTRLQPAWATTATASSTAAYRRPTATATACRTIGSWQTA